MIYFRVKFIYRLITELLGFWSAFTILGMNYVKAFYLVIIICLSRSVGECINILIFKMTGKRFADHKGAFLLLMLAGLFVAYFVPYVRGCVPAAYIRIFDSIWVAAILGTGSVLHIMYGPTEITKRLYQEYIRKNSLMKQKMEKKTGYLIIPMKE